MSDIMINGRGLVLSIFRCATYDFFHGYIGLQNDAQDATKCVTEDNMCAVRFEEIMVLLYLLH